MNSTVRTGKLTSDSVILLSSRKDFDLSRQIEFIYDSEKLRQGTKHPVVVRINLDRPTKVRGIHARFYAAERTRADYTETYRDSKGRTKTRTRTAVEDHPIADQYVHLFGDPKPGFFEVIGDALATLVGSSDHEILQPGVYDYPIELEIPADAPASFKGKKCEAFYSLDVRIDIPVWSDPKQDHQFQLLRLPTYATKSAPVLVRHPDPENGQGFWERSFGIDVKADVALDRDDLIAGQEFSGMIHLVPNDAFRLDGIDVALVGTEKTRARGHADVYQHVHSFPMIGTPANVTKPFTHEFRYEVPDMGLYTSKGENYSIDWAVKVRMDVPWALDPVVEIPIEYFYSEHKGK